MNKQIIVAWVSRHPALKAQEEVLKAQLLSDIKIVEMNKTYKNASVIIKLLKEHGAKYAVVVLPLSIIKHLLNAPDRDGIVFLKAEMKPATGEYNPDWDVLMEDEPGIKRHKTFTGYQVYREILEITEPFEVHKS